MADSDTAICNLALLKMGDTKTFIEELATDATLEGQTLRLIYPQKRDNLLKAYKWGWSTARAYPAQIGGQLWVSTTTYARGDCAAFVPDPTKVANVPQRSSTFVYLSLADGNTGNAPDSSPTQWKQIGRPEWACIFQVPGDLLEARGVYPGLRNPREDQKLAYAIETEPSPGPGKILLTDGAPPWDCLSSPSTLTRQIGIIYTARITDPQQFPSDFVEALAWDMAVDLCVGIRKDADEALRCQKAAAMARAEAIAADRRQRQHDPPPLPSHIAARFSRRR